MAKLTLAQWFETHPKARAEIEKWLHQRRHSGGGGDGNKKGGGLRSLLATLKEKHEYPFSDYVTLSHFARKEFGNTLYTAATRRVKVDPEVIAERGRKSKRRPKPITETFQRSDADVRRLEGHHDFFVSSAVANCTANPGFLAAVERWREERNGKIVLNPIRYKNPTRRGDIDRNEQWDSDLRPYLLDSEVRPHEFLSIMPTKMAATTSNPLPARLDGRTKARSAIFGHPQLAMRTVPTPQNRLPKILYSSGAITMKDDPMALGHNYSDTLAGDMGNFHHSYAGVIAEVRGENFHLREVVWDGRGFVDCERYYTADGIEDAPPALALAMGDIHCGLEDEDVMEATFGTNGIYSTIRPQAILVHDVFDGRTVNPHEALNRLTAAVRAHRGQNKLADELKYTGQWLNALPKDTRRMVVRSNHDEFLMRWLQKGEKGVESHNVRLYHELCAAMIGEAEAHPNGKFPIPLELALRPYLDEGIEFLDYDDSYRPGGVELAMHGHLGPNGAQGGIRALSRIGTRFVTGHTHSPSIWQGGYQAGHSSQDRHGYNVGPSGWFKAHVQVCFNGYRQMFFIIGREFRG